MKKLFYGSGYKVRHSTITPDNVCERLSDDIRTRMTGDVKAFVYGTSCPLSINSSLFYIGGFYYEPFFREMPPCSSTTCSELSEIDEADVVMLSFLCYSSIATVTELMYASQFPEKEVVVFLDPAITRFRTECEYWFPLLAARQKKPDIRTVYVQSEEDILSYIRHYPACSQRLILEGTDGVGKTSLASLVREAGISCLDREKTAVSKNMLPEIPVSVRASACQRYLASHPGDALAILLNHDGEELSRRLRSRGKALDAFDMEAAMYNTLYQETADFLLSHDMAPGQVFALDITGLSLDETMDRIYGILPLLPITGLRSF